MDALHEHGCICVPASSKTHLEMMELNKFRNFRLLTSSRMVPACAGHRLQNPNILAETQTRFVTCWITSEALMIFTIVRFGISALQNYRRSPD